MLPSARVDVSCMRGAHPLRLIRVGARSPTGFSIRPRKSSATRRGRALAVSPVAYHGDRQQYSGKDKEYGADDAPWKKKVKWRLDDEEDEENQRRGSPPRLDPTTAARGHRAASELRQAQARRGSAVRTPAQAARVRLRTPAQARGELVGGGLADRQARRSPVPARRDRPQAAENAGVDLRQADFDEMEARADEYHMEEAARDEARVNSSRDTSSSGWDEGGPAGGSTAGRFGGYRVTNEWPNGGVQVANSDEEYAEWCKSFSFQVAVRLRAHGVHPSHLDDRARWVLEMAGVAPDWVDYYYATHALGDAQENSWDEWDQRASERAHASAADLSATGRTSTGRGRRRMLTSGW